MINLETLLPEIRHAVVLVPHPDDEAIGCGALLTQLTARSIKLSVILATNGDGAGELPEGTSQLRLAEFEQSLEHLGVKELPEYWLLDDGFLSTQTQLAERVKLSIERASPDLIIAPWQGDLHPDHSALGAAVAALPSSVKAHRVYYEVWNPLPANAFIDATDVWQIKLSALKLHKTALLYGDYVHAMTGLAAYRSLLLPFDPKRQQYAEAYILELDQKGDTTSPPPGEIRSYSLGSRLMRWLGLRGDTP